MADSKKLFLGDKILSFDEVEEGMHEFLYNPMNPAPTIGGRNLIWPAGPMEQSELERRDDVLIYTSPILNESVAIA